MNDVFFLCVFAGTDPIAFSVALTSSITVSPGDIIKFNYVFVDTNGVYNPNVGIFTIPQTGVYEVNVNMFKATTSTYNHAFADLYVNETPLTGLENYYPDGEGTAHSSCTIIREFTKENTLYVQAANPANYWGDYLARSQFNVKYLGEVPQGV